MRSGPEISHDRFGQEEVHGVRVALPEHAINICNRTYHTEIKLCRFPRHKMYIFPYIPLTFSLEI